MKKYLLFIALAIIVTGCSKEIETKNETAEINTSENVSWPEYEGKYEKIETITVHPKPDTEEKIAKILLTVKEGSAMFRESTHYTRHNVIYVREGHCFGRSGEMPRRNLTKEIDYGFREDIKEILWPGYNQSCDLFELVEIVDEKTVIIEYNEWLEPPEDVEGLQLILSEKELIFWEPTWDYYINYHLRLMDVQG